MTAPLDSTLVAQFLTDNPQFFEEHADLLGEIKLSSPLTGRAVSLQERQMEVLRDKYKTLELRMHNLMRLASENEAIANTKQISLGYDYNLSVRTYLYVDGTRKKITPAATFNFYSIGIHHNF